MRLFAFLIRVGMPAITAAALYGQVQVSLGTTSGCSTLQGGQTCNLTARVTGATNAAVTWSFNPTVAGATPGTGSAPDATGLSTNSYKAPNFVAARQVVTATATSVADPSKAASAPITLVPVTITIAVTPTTVNLNAGQTQAFTATVSGISETGVTWSISPQVGAIDGNTGLYTAPSSITAAQKVTVTATSTFDSTVSGTATVNLQPPPTISVTVSPATVTLNNNQTQQFTAAVQNSTAGVTWSLNPQIGTIDSTGLYTAPGIVTGSQKITVTATSNGDPTKSGTATITLATVVDVGLGAPANLIQQFVTAFYRNGFSLLVSLPPQGNVTKFGTTGYSQVFSDAAKSGAKLALVTASPTAPISSDGSVIQVVQLLANLYGYYSTVGVSTAGYPLMDTQNCPSFDPSNSCEFDFFDKGYALFAYAAALPSGQNFTIRQAFYTEWTALGGMTGPGRPVDVETTITASTSTTATVQAFASGAIYSISSGVNKGKTLGVIEPLYDLYVSQGGPAGTLGLPTGEVIQVSTGVYRQSFEGGNLQYTSSGGPVVQLPVTLVTLKGAPGSSITLNLGQTLTVTAIPSGVNGAVFSDRPVSWSTTNGKVISIQASGATAVLSAVGGGAASVTASSQGVTSAKLNFTVIAPCCQIGAGAPGSVQQTFQDALARNRISVQLPAQSAASRVGSGYVQMVQSSDPAAPVIYMLAQSDQAATAYIVSGTILMQYQALGGPAGTLGYPASDPSEGGTQLFLNNSALAGNPVRLVSGGVLAKWKALGYESGAAGPPTSDALEFSTFGANSGFAQSFRGGMIYAASEGPRAGQAYFVTGLILARHNELGGAAGDYGMPVSDEFVTGALHQQNFEGGNIAYTTGDTAATEHAAPKVPGVVAAPQTVTAGGVARLAIMGFPNNSVIRVSVTGQNDFLVSTVNGAYSWEMSVPLTARSGTIAIHAADTKSSATAEGALAIRGFADNRIPIAKVLGDNQTGMPGALLPLSLRVALRDSSGTPVVSAMVTFQASPGVQISAASAVTDASGQAETFVRLPMAEGIAAVTVDAPSIAQAPVSFYMRSAAATLSNFPKLIEAGEVPLGKGSATIGRKGALLTAVASILRYHQNRGELPAPYGAADPDALNQFLVSYCLYDTVKNGQLCDGFLSNPDSGEQIVNLWRATEFTGGLDVAVQKPTTAAIADLLAQGYPALLSLALTLNGSAAGGHYVVATGVAADGSIIIQDPNPLFARASLNDYFNGFSTGGGTWKADLRGVVQFARRSPSGTRFMVGALSQPPALMQSLTLDVQSAIGPCGSALDLWDAVDSLGNMAPLLSRIQACDGVQPAYLITAGEGQAYHAFVTDLAIGGTTQDISGGTAVTYQASRPQLALTLATPVASFSADAVVNAATFTSGIAPGGIISIFGTGLSGPGMGTAVEMDGAAVQVLWSTPFQLNAVVPADVQPGMHVLKITSAYGSTQQAVPVSSVSPAIFLVGNPPVGAVLNQNNTLNGPANPLPRGQVLVIYATGLGAVTRQGQYSVAATPVTVVLNGQELTPSYAGLAPGTSGEYQVNVVIPPLTAPGLGISLTLKQGGGLSNTVSVAVQ